MALRTAYFQSIDYLKHGNQKQKAVFQLLLDLKLWQILADYGPVLAGTVPIGIDTSNSDLDVLCQVSDFDELEYLLQKEFSAFENFLVVKGEVRSESYLSVSFKHLGFIIEVFAQLKPAIEQHAFRHMIIEDYFLMSKGEAFKTKIIALKNQGIKTEHAFAKVLGLSGDPYLELLKLEKQIKLENG